MVSSPRMMLRVALLQGDPDADPIANISDNGSLSSLMNDCRDRWGVGKLVRLKETPAELIESNTEIHAVYAWILEPNEFEAWTE